MYIFKMKKYTKDKKKHKYTTIPPYYLLGLLILLISFILIAKELIKSNYEKATVLSVAACTEINRDASINEAEQAPLTMIKDVMKPSDRVGKRKSQNVIYYNVMKEYLERDHISLSSDQVSSISEKLLRIQEILSGEMQTDYMKLSLDGKKITFYLMGQIYEDIGLHLEGNSEGVIMKITAPDGSVLYNSNPSKLMKEFRWDALLVVLIFNCILFIICLTIARKNRLFHKEELYDGIEKEKFA